MEMGKGGLPQVAIVELGSQYTLVIERTLRELGVRSVILQPDKTAVWLEKNPPKAVILSGGPSGVNDSGAPEPPAEVLNFPLLGICYGMQWIAKHLGGNVRSVDGNREYGQAKISLSDGSNRFFAGTPKEQEVWMSHGDSVTLLPSGFYPLAYTGNNTVAAMTNGNIWGVQFHPEVSHTQYGKGMLSNFLFWSAGCYKDWEPRLVVDDIRQKALNQLGDRKAIIGFSGGVDSTTVSAILAPILGGKLLAVTIDGDHLRECELDEIERHASAACINLKVIKAGKKFAAVMSGITDAEEKRRRFKEVYTSILLEEARIFGAEAIIQGTLATDKIESGNTGGAKIKSHHNVGLDFGGLTEARVIDHLFKYEVRALSREVGLPESVWNRQPFPGPGLFLRVVGTPATPDKLEIVRWADGRVKEILVRHGLYGDISQLVVAYLGVPTVAVKGDGRSYEGSVVVRAVKTLDFMTAEGVWLPEKAAKMIASVLTTHPKINRVWFDPTDKPPATTEME
jgi:GMP synthase (glutamine-hydrolysing)